MRTKIFESMKDEDFDQALRLIEEMESKSAICSNLLVAKGRCILLAEELRYQLEDAKRCFKDAINIDENNIEAILELAHYYYAVVDDSKKAGQYFDDALIRTKKLMTEAIVGKAKCIAETVSEGEAVNFLNQIETKDMDVVNALIDELEY